MTEPEGVRERLADALAQALAPEGELIVGWTVAIESIGVAGNTGIWVVASAGLEEWDYDGYLAYAMKYPPDSVMSEEIDEVVE